MYCRYWSARIPISRFNTISRTKRMEVKKADTMVLVRPVASRPSRSRFMSLSELVAGAISVSPPTAFSDATIIAIRPKTMRLKPVVDSAPVGVISSQVQTRGPQSDKAKQFLPTRLASVHFLNSPSQMEMNQTVKSSKLKLQDLAKNKRSLSPSNSGDQLSYDGYNWRKYGQKQVKGSERPRSYYKCTHPNCLVKKKVEKSVDGKISEIVYEGQHIHPRTELLLKHLPSEAQEGYKFNETREETGIPLSNILLNEVSEGGVEDQNEVDLLIDPTCPDKALIPHEPITTRISNKGVRIPNNPSGPAGDCEEGSRRADAEDDQPECKQRNDGQSKKSSITRQGVREPRVMVRNSRDSELLRDGFRWRKYGQKVVKGNPYPRSYYRCTNLMCNMRKHVERAHDDPTAFITTYEGKHNHELPGTERSNIPVASDFDSLVAPSKQNQAI